LPCGQEESNQDLRARSSSGVSFQQVDELRYFRKWRSNELRWLGCLAVVRRRDTIQSRLNPTVPTKTIARVQTLGGTVPRFAALLCLVQIVVTRAPGVHPEFGETESIALRRQRHAQHVTGPAFRQRSSARRCAPVVAPRPGLGHGQPRGHHVNTTVNDDHQRQGNIERAHGGVYLVAEILARGECQSLQRRTLTQRLGCLAVKAIVLKNPKQTSPFYPATNKMILWSWLPCDGRAPGSRDPG